MGRQEATFCGSRRGADAGHRQLLFLSTTGSLPVIASRISLWTASLAASPDWCTQTDRERLTQTERQRDRDYYSNIRCIVYKRGWLIACRQKDNKHPFDCCWKRNEGEDPRRPQTALQRITHQSAVSSCLLRTESGGERPFKPEPVR